MPLSRYLRDRPGPGRLLLGATVPWWRRSRRRIWRWLVAVGLAAVAVGLVTVRVDEAARTVAGLGRTRAVTVARRDLEVGRVLAADDLVTRTLPVDAIPDEAADGEIEGRTVTAAIGAGEVVSARRLAPDGVDGLAALVPAGRRAIAVPTGGTGLRLDVGDRVDVLDPADGASYEGDSSSSSTVTASDAVVIAVDDAAVTLAVDRADAPSVARALAAGPPVLALTGVDPDR